MIDATLEPESLRRVYANALYGDVVDVHLLCNFDKWTAALRAEAATDGLRLGFGFSVEDIPELCCCELQRPARDRRQQWGLALERARQRVSDPARADEEWENRSRELEHDLYGVEPTGPARSES